MHTKPGKSAHRESIFEILCHPDGRRGISFAVDRCRTPQRKLLHPLERICLVGSVNEGGMQ
jgi:hypothetical protein